MRRRKLQKAGQIPAEFPKIDLNDRIFRHGLDIVLVATIVNLLVVAMASYRGAAYMDSPQFCGQSCHVMHPEYTAYKISAHSHVACVECHIGSGAQAYFSAKVNGTKQLLEVSIRSLSHADSFAGARVCARRASSARAAIRRPGSWAKNCWSSPTLPTMRQNSETQTVLVLHLGGEDSLSHLTGIHGVHLNHMEYIATDSTRTTIPWVQRENSDGSETVFASSALNGVAPKGERREMDCIDCHNRAAHTFVTAEEAINRAMADGAISPELPWVHKEGLELLHGDLRQPGRSAREDPRAACSLLPVPAPRGAAAKAALVKSAGATLVTLYCQNVFPDMKVTWGTHPNHIGHMSYPGCFRCHDGDHVAKDGKALPRTAPTATTCWPWKRPSPRYSPTWVSRRRQKTAA